MDSFLTSVKDGRKAVNIGHTKFYELINEGVIETVKVGNRRLVVVESLRKLASQGAA